MTATVADFVSVDPALAALDRDPDGTFPFLMRAQLFVLTAQSAMVNAGIDVGLPFLGAAPDIGAMERGVTMPKTLTLTGAGFSNVGGGTYTVKTELMNGTTIIATGTSVAVVVPPDPPLVPVATTPVVVVS